MKIKKFYFLVVAIGFTYLVSIGPKSFQQNSQGITVELRKELLHRDDCSTPIHILNDHSNNIWKELESAIHLTHNQCETLRKKNDSDYTNALRDFLNSQENGTGLSSETHTLVLSVLKDFELSPEMIIIAPFDHYCPAAANDYALFINEKLFNTLTLKAKKFCIAHELQHFIYKDNSTMEAILTHCKVNHKTDFPQEHPVNKLSRFNEIRADVVAASKSEEYAQGYKEFMEKTISIIGDGAGITHPKNSLRLTYALDIINNKTLSIV